MAQPAPDVVIVAQCAPDFVETMTRRLGLVYGTSVLFLAGSPELVKVWGCEQSGAGSLLELTDLLFNDLSTSDREEFCKRHGFF